MPDETINLCRFAATLCLCACSGASQASAPVPQQGARADAGADARAMPSAADASTDAASTPVPGPGAGALAFALDEGVDNPLVDGLAVRLGWGRLEPSEGSYDWTRLDQTLAKVTAAGKSATLHVFGAVGQGSTPEWVRAAGAQFYTWNGRTEPVPWDGVFLDKWSAFLPKLAEHLRSTSTISAIAHVSITVPVPEMNLISCANGMLDSASVPYDRARYLAAWKRMIDLYQATFPDQIKLVSAPQNGICRADRDVQFYHEVMAYALGKDPQRYWLFAADLSATGSGRIEPYQDIAAQAHVGFQPVAAFSSDPNHWVHGTMLELYCHGLALGARYFEVYASDLTNVDAAVQSGISAIHDPNRCGR